jgi:hypothetical protein
MNVRNTASVALHVHGANGNNSLVVGDLKPGFFMYNRFLLKDENCFGQLAM